MTESASPAREATDDHVVAYFSMEIALEEKIPTYSGGLGVLAGDTVRSAADLEIPLVGVSLVHRKGYLRQRLDAAGNQIEEPAPWAVGDLLKEAHARASVEIEQRAVQLRAWIYEVKGISGFVVPVLLARLGCRRQLRMGPHADRFPIRRRRSLPTLPRSRSRHRGRAYPARPGLSQRQALPHERRACQLADPGTRA